MSVPTVGVVIVNYNGGDLTLDCLRRLRATAWPADRFQVVLVDNASSDGVVDTARAEWPDVRIIESDRNLGFAGGCNLALHRGEPGQIYNIGAGNETPNRVLVDKLLALFGASEESVQYVTDRLGHDRRYSVDIAKISALGWQKQRTLDEALAETVEWYRANRWWWEPLKATDN